MAENVRMLKVLFEQGCVVTMMSRVQPMRALYQRFAILFIPASDRNRNQLPTENLIKTPASDSRHRSKMKLM